MDVVTLAISKSFTTKKIQELEERYGTLFKLKGSKQVYSQLPTLGQVVGDVWYVEEDETISGITYPGEVGYVWLNDNGVYRWEPLGPSIDLSDYYTKFEVSTLLGNKAPLASPTFTGTPTAPTAPAGTNSTQIATTAFVQTAINSIVNGNEVSY